MKKLMLFLLMILNSGIMYAQVPSDLEITAKTLLTQAVQLQIENSCLSIRKAESLYLAYLLLEEKNDVKFISSNSRFDYAYGFLQKQLIGCNNDVFPGLEDSNGIITVSYILDEGSFIAFNTVPPELLRGYAMDEETRAAYLNSLPEEVKNKIGTWKEANPGAEKLIIERIIKAATLNPSPTILLEDGLQTNFIPTNTLQGISVSEKVVEELKKTQCCD